MSENPLCDLGNVGLLNIYCIVAHLCCALEDSNPKTGHSEKSKELAAIIV